jgi:sugar phosphate isomerase/epimerase
MYKSLSLPALGHSAFFDEVCDLAQKHDFSGVELDMSFLHQLASDLRAENAAVTWFTNTTLKPAGFWLRAAWRETDNDEAFLGSLEAVAADAKLSAALGCKRCFTTIPPSSESRDFYQHFDLVVPRLIRVANILASNGIMLGFEFIGSPLLRSPQHKDFVHTLDGARTFAAAIGMHSLNTGVLLDSLHWHTSGGTVQEIEHLDHNEVVYVHLNDAAEIDTKGFLGALRSIGYAGPLTLKPTCATTTTPTTTTPTTTQRSPEEAAMAATETLNRLLG